MNVAEGEEAAMFFYVLRILLNLRIDGRFYFNIFPSVVDNIFPTLF